MNAKLKQIQRLVGMIFRTQKNEIDCGECFELLPSFVDDYLGLTAWSEHDQGQRFLSQTEFNKVVNHQLLCPCCKEECQQVVFAMQ